MSLLVKQARHAHPRDPAPHDGRVAISSPARHLARDLAGLTVIKLLVLALIYVLCFWGTSHRLSLDTAAHIVDPPASAATR